MPDGKRSETAFPEYPFCYIDGLEPVPIAGQRIERLVQWGKRGKLQGVGQQGFKIPGEGSPVERMTPFNDDLTVKTCGAGAKTALVGGKTLFQPGVFISLKGKTKRPAGTRRESNHCEQQQQPTAWADITVC